jgi:DNA-binding NarL/FixJ family response regulator
MPKRATQFILTEKEREELVQITRRHRSKQQQAQRARMILASAQGDSNTQTARELRINVDTVRFAGWDYRASIWTPSASHFP